MLEFVATAFGLAAHLELADGLPACGIVGALISLQPLRCRREVQGNGTPSGIRCGVIHPHGFQGHWKRARRPAFAGRRAWRWGRREARNPKDQALKLEPQPQLEVAFGLLNTKPEPMISSL